MTGQAAKDMETLTRVQEAVDILKLFAKGELEGSAHCYLASLVLVSVVQGADEMSSNLEAVVQEIVSQLDFGIQLLDGSEDD